MEIFLKLFKIKQHVTQMSNSKTCDICYKNFPSCSTMRVHKREKHTFYNTIVINCPGCARIFNSPGFNKHKNKYYDRCEECRNLSQTLKTRPLTHGTCVYGVERQRYFINYGEAIRACPIYDCYNIYPCDTHTGGEDDVSECTSTKCNNCYIKNGFNFCERCRDKNDKSKNKLRNEIKRFKEELGGKCVDCGFDELFYLEFDHINPYHKTIQITRSSPKDWQNEKWNLELRCGRCHRIKTYKDRQCSIVKGKNFECKNDKKLFVNSVKKAISCCQNCKWSFEDKELMCSALDFDHVSGAKYKKISDLYTNKKTAIAKETLSEFIIHLRK